MKPFVIALLALAGAAQAQTLPTLRVGLAEDPDVLDPTLARSFVGRVVFSALCDKLFDIDEKLNIVPQLAEKYEWSADSKALTIKVGTEDHLKLDSIVNILLERSTKQKIDVKSYDLKEEPQPSGKLLYKTIKIQNGIEREKAKKIVKAIKDMKLKVEPQIQDDQIRVNGKKFDDLQAVMAMCRATDFEVPLQFENMKS